MHTILLIDDDERLSELLHQYFERHNLALSSAIRPSDGLKKLAMDQFDLVILDIMLPEMDGFEVCRTIRKQSDVPILMLTARGDVMDRVVGLELGADDYLPKPFEPRELVARIQNILKRAKSTSVQQNILTYGELKIDTTRRQVFIADKSIDLSTMEYQLLELFAKTPGKIFTRDEILNQLKGIETDILSRSVDILVSRLRQKLKPQELIKTVRGSGYVFVGKTG
ncbi:response regulator transcription factor [Kaarinaea lacus]